MNIPKGAITSRGELWGYKEAWGVRPWDRGISRWFLEDGVWQHEFDGQHSITGYSDPDSGWFSEKSQCWIFLNYWDARAYKLLIQVD